MYLLPSFASLLVNAGVIIRDMRPEADSEGYWFSVPNIGAFMKGCIKGRQEVISFLKRQKHKEMLQEVWIITNLLDA